MTYFCAQLFTMDTEIRAMFPAAMEVQRRRFFHVLSRIAAALQNQEARDRLVSYLREFRRAHREIVLYYGARRQQDLFDLSALREMEAVNPWLQVIQAVPDEPAHDDGIMYGTVPELAAKAAWVDRDGYVGGPDHMIVKTARAVRERGALTA
jgi:Oxidoreductase NAD-binding domain